MRLEENKLFKIASLLATSPKNFQGIERSVCLLFQYKEV